MVRPGSDESPASYRLSERDSNAAGHYVCFLLPQAAGIADVVGELEITCFVGALDVPLAEVVAEAASHGVSIIEMWFGQGSGFGGGEMEAGSKFWLALRSYEDLK